MVIVNSNNDDHWHIKLDIHISKFQRADSLNRAIGRLWSIFVSTYQSVTINENDINASYVLSIRAIFSNHSLQPILNTV